VHFAGSADAPHRHRPQSRCALRVRGRDLGSTVLEAQRKIAEEVLLPAGYRLEWVGEFGNLQDAIKRLRVIVPLTILLIGILLYINFASLTDTLLGVAVIPMAMIGGVFALLLTGRAGARRHQLGGSDRRRYRSAAVSRNPCVLSFRSRKVG